MKKGIQVTIVLSLIIGILGGLRGAEVAAANELPFSDISKHWAKDNILKAYESGLVEGFPDGTFRPDDVVQGDQFIVMMLRAHSVTKNGKTEFDPAWYEEMKQRQPGLLYKFMVAAYEMNFNFKSATSGYWAKPFIDFIYETPFIETYDLVFPKEYNLFKKQIMREEASYLLGQWHDRFEMSYQRQYSDFVLQRSGIKDIDSFGLEEGAYRSAILISGLMNGYPDKHFYPKRYVTRAEALTMVQRLRDASLRKPFKPDLTGQLYTEDEGTIYMFSDKLKYDTFIKYLELAKTLVKSGYFAQEGSHLVTVYKSKDDYDKYEYMTRSGMYENRPMDEVTATVGVDNYKQLGISFPVKSSFPNSKDFLSALYELLAGDGKGQELKASVDSLISKGGPETTFKLNKKNFKFFTSGDRYYLDLYY